MSCPSNPVREISLSIFIGAETDSKRVSKFPNSQLVSGKVYTLSLGWDPVIKLRQLWAPITWGRILAFSFTRFLAFGKFLNSPEP